MSEDFIEHVINGEPEHHGRGGHLFGTGREGKTEFPENWNQESILNAMRSVLDSPESISISGTNIYLHKTVDGVEIEMKLLRKKDKLIPMFCFPRSGLGVIRNVGGSKIYVDGQPAEEGE